MASYVELHCHSCFSFREGASTPLELVLQARKLGYPALALTDHDGLAGAMEFAQTAKEWEVQPIIGSEITFQSGTHLTLLAETPRGYANLSRLLSIAHLESPRGEPSLDPAALEGHTEGLIALSGCQHGEVPRLASHDAVGARAAAQRYRDLFGREHFFIELQQNLVYGDRPRNRGLVELARELDIPIVATNNVHYHQQSRHRLQDVLVAVRHRTTLDASERQRRNNAEFYLKSPGQMAELFSELPKAIKNTLAIAERCVFDLTRDLTYQFPDFDAPPGKTADEFLEEVCMASARELYGWAAPQAEERIKHELALIQQAGQAGFFLRNWELMRYAHDNDLPARGRGSSVGSLVCYLLGLSGIDPIKYNLFVGRFLNEARQKEDVPDIDLDFAREARERMFEHVFETYGTEHAALVANVIQYRYPMAIRDVGKALGLPEADIDKLAKRMRGRFARSLDEEMRSLPEFRQRMNAPVWRTFAQLVEELRGKPRHLSQHSGGVIISSTPIVEQVPVQPSAMDGRYICQWDKDSVADAGFIKMDFLGYPSLGHLYRSLKLIEERHGRRIDPVRIPLDDPQVYEMIRRGDILGIVQIQSRAQLQAILRLEINSIEDLVIQVALIRPGPIQGGAVNPYIARCQGVEPVTYDHPCLEPVLSETKGVIIFQEQVLEVAMAVAGFTAGQAETLRRAMSRKRSREEMEKLHETFLEGARKQGKVDAATAESIYQKVLAFAEFGFPKAHAAAMAETAGKLAWVKRYYPLEFYCSWLNEWPFGFYSPGVITNEARRNGVEVLGVDANRSRAECSIEKVPDGDEAIRLGFNYVKGIGEAWLARLDEEHYRHAEPFAPAQDKLREASSSSRTTVDLKGSDPSLTLRVTDASRDYATADRQIAPLPFAGEGTGVREEREPYPAKTDPSLARHAEPFAPAQDKLHEASSSSRTTVDLKGSDPSLTLGVTEALVPGPYLSLWDFWRRTQLPREPIERLIRLGAFAWTGLHERQLLWQLGLFYKPLSGQLPLELPYDADMVRLREMSDGERVREDIGLTEGAIATRGHIMDLAGPSAGSEQSLHEGITPSHIVTQMEEGAKVSVAGFVAVRQAPETAKGFVFHTLEDRYGLINIITKPNLVQRYKQLVAEAGALIVHGHIERQERAVNVVTEHMEPLPLQGARVPSSRTHSFR
ncbi:MAG: error-prone DNA polymerase [Chloroflexi bacterium]|nr:error-prone DNA polymerase [Chloroflexota bacterium]